VHRLMKLQEQEDQEQVFLIIH